MRPRPTVNSTTQHEATEKKKKFCRRRDHNNVLLHNESGSPGTIAFAPRSLTPYLLTNTVFFFLLYRNLEVFCKPWTKKK